MEIRTDVIQAYLQGEIPDGNSWFYAYTGGTAPISAARQEVCTRLCEECLAYRKFPIWNGELITALFPNHDKWLNEVVFLPIVGSRRTFDASLIIHDNRPFLLIDLLNIADYTQSVKEMCYILHNLCHIQLLRYLFHQRLPVPIDPEEQLNYRFFCEGWILYLAWNENIREYKFHTSAYNAIKPKVFRLLYRALTAETPQIQRILQALDQVDLWDRFPDIAGMFFCDDVFQHQGLPGLQAYFASGWKYSAKRLFTASGGAAGNDSSSH